MVNEKAIKAKAAELIRRRGWCQGELESDEGCLCILGALNTVLALVPDDTYPGMMEYLKFVHGLIPEGTGFRYIAQWNDEKGRTVEQVLALLEGCGEDED